MFRIGSEWANYNNDQINSDINISIKIDNYKTLYNKSINITDDTFIYVLKPSYLII